MTFEIWKDGTLLVTITDSGGRIRLPYAEPGTYKVRNHNGSPPSLNETEFTIENNSEYPTFFTIPNVMKRISRSQRSTRTPASRCRASFLKPRWTAGALVTLPPARICSFTIPYADSGTYIFKEYHTLAGYELNREPIVIEHTTDGNVDIVVIMWKIKILLFIKNRQ